MNRLVIMMIATWLTVMPVQAQVNSYVATPGLYYIYNGTSGWAQCRVTYSRTYWHDFWLAPWHSSPQFPLSTTWYCEIP